MSFSSVQILISNKNDDLWSIFWIREANNTFYGEERDNIWSWQILKIQKSIVIHKNRVIYIRQYGDF